MEQIYKLTPRPYQRAIVEEHWSDEAQALFLEQGLGKSKVTLDQLMYMHQYRGLEGVVILSKLMVVENWYKEELDKHINVPYQSFLYTAKGRRRVPKTWQPSDKLQILLINDGQFRTKHGFEKVKSFLETYNAGIVIDESTLIKNPTAKLTKAMQKLVMVSRWRRILSGEPAPQGPQDYFSQYQFLAPGIFGTGSFMAYKNRFCKQKSIWVNGREIRNPTREFNHGMQEQFERIVSDCTVRLRKTEVLKELPPKQYQRIVFELPVEVQREYNRLAEEYYAEVMARDPEEKASVTALVAIARITRLHQLACGHVVADDGNLRRVDSGRVEVLESLLEQRPANSKTIVWCHYRDNIDELRERLPSTAYVYGGMSAAERTANLEAFQRGGAAVLLANPSAAGHGLTLVEADTAIYYSNSYNFEHRAQSEDRIHRIGQTAQSVMYYDIVAEGTVDERILDVLKSKQDFSQSVMKDLSEWLKKLV